MNDAQIITTKNFTDERGDFLPFEIKKLLPDFNLVQVNTVINNSPFIFRGLHWQEPPYAQTKVIRCISGQIIDFIIDIRTGSPTYGKLSGFILNTPDNWLYIPKGFAHGYVTMPSKGPIIVEYLVDNEYNTESERGLNFADRLNNLIKEEIQDDVDLIVNDRDLHWPDINEINTEFKYEPEEQ